MMWKPKQIRIAECRGIEGDAVNGLPGQKERRVSGLHMLLAAEKRNAIVAHAFRLFPLPSGESSGSIIDPLLNVTDENFP